MSSPEQESSPNSALPISDPGTSHEIVDHSTDSSDSDNNDSKHDVVVAKKRSTFAHRMLMLCKEITIMVFIAATYAAITNESPPKVSKSPAAYPFFPKDSIVSDWYRGQVTEAIEEARSSDIAFVMFYAPWDAESQAARKELELTARFLDDRVNFAAINCWQPLSECKRQYSKVYKWPVLIAYPTHGRGIQYNGPLEAFHMVSFLNNICKPLVRPQHIDDLLGKHDSIVLANINVLPGSYEYAILYSTALQFLEKDPFRDIIFAVIPQRRDISPKLTFYVWNSTIIYEGEWNSENLSSWILKNLKQVTAWVAPTATKSLNLASYIQPGPSLILFTPKNPLLEQIDNFNMLRKVAYDYYNCANNTQFNDRQKLIDVDRLHYYENYQKLKEKCSQKPSQRIITNAPNVWTNTTVENICNCPLRKACPKIEKLAEDPNCRDFLMAETHSPAIFETKGRDTYNITGLFCQTNLTLSFIAMDSLQFYHFAEKLGVDLSSLEDKSISVILDEKLETHYIMQNQLNGANLNGFIQNFTQSGLERSLRSKTMLKSKTTHVYPYQSLHKDLFVVHELTSKDFLSTILQASKVVVVFYYSKQCAFCSGISYVFLTVAKMLQDVPNLVFARTDGDSNLLPWEYTMESYPTILFFPAFRKAESRAFPKNLLITVPNLVGFILANAEPSLKLKTLWALCVQTKIEEERKKCLTSIRIETLSVIDRTLREWRISTQKHHVLYNLQVLRHLHLLFAHSPHEVAAIRKYLNKLKH